MTMKTGRTPRGAGPDCNKLFLRALVATRIVGTVVAAVRNAVAVTVAVDRVGHAVAVTIAAGVSAAAIRIALAVPAALLEVPAAVALFPAARMPVHAGALPHPVAPDP